MCADRRGPFVLLTDRVAARYLALGAATTAAGFVLILALRPHLGEEAANALAYVLMTPVAFVVHRSLSFRHRGAAAPAFARYVASLGVAVVVNQVALRAALGAGLGGVAAQAIAVSVCVAMQLLIARVLVFPEEQRT